MSKKGAGDAAASKLFKDLKYVFSSAEILRGSCDTTKLVKSWEPKCNLVRLILKILAVWIGA